MNLSNLENYEFIGLFQIEVDSKNFQLSGKIIYTSGSEIEVLFLCPKSDFSSFIKLKGEDFENMRGTIMTIPERNIKHVCLKNLLYFSSPELTENSSSFLCKYQYILFADSLELFDSKINKIRFGLSEVDKFFDRTPHEALVSKEIYNENFDNKTINISWGFSSYIGGKFSSHLKSFNNEKNTYYSENADKIDNNFKEFLINNNIDEFDFKFIKKDLKPIIDLAFNNDEKNSDNSLKIMFDVLRLFEIVINQSIIPDFITFTTNNQIQEWRNNEEKPLFDINGNIRYSTYKDSDGSEKIAKTPNGGDAILYERELVNIVDSNGNPCYHDIRVLYGFTRKQKINKKNLRFSENFGQFTFNSIIENNINLFNNWNVFYSDKGIREILDFIYIMQSEGYWYPNFILSQVLATINYIGCSLNKTTKEKPHGGVNENGKLFFEKYGTDIIIQKIAVLLNPGLDISNKSRENLIDEIVDFNSPLFGKIRNTVAHASETSLNDNNFRNKAIEEGLIWYLLLIIKNFCYQKAGIDKLKTEEMISKISKFF
jgi:hypothetical protein